MSQDTKIEWADHTFNPWIGCNPISPGCVNCYAADWAKRYGRDFAARTRTKTWGDPVKWNERHDDFFAQHGRRQRVFCASLADVFDNAVDPMWRADLFWLIKQTPHLDWLLLTKRIGNARTMMADAIATIDPMAEWVMPLKNIWLGATIVNQEEAGRDIPKLLSVPATKRFLSMEPLLSPVDLTRIEVWNGDAEIYPLTGTTGCIDDEGQESDDVPALDWVIVGGESGPGARPMHPDWARSLRNQCEAAGVPFLFKQWGEWMPSSSGDFCRSQNAPEHAAFREKHGRGGYEFAGKEGRAIIADGRTCLSQSGGSVWQKPAAKVVDSHAMANFNHYVRTGNGDPGYQWMFAVGKRAAGRQLDGRTWDGYPTC